MVELVALYVSGATVYELGEKFGVHRDTVSSHLRLASVKLRRQGLDEHQVDEAVRLYSDGWSLARVGEQLGVDAKTVWSALRNRGVVMRDSHGRLSS